MTDDTALRRLLADLPADSATEATHQIDPGALGEYADVCRRHGPEAASDAYPRIADHLRAGCDRCEADLADLDALALLDESPRRRADGQRPGDRPATTPAPLPPASASAPALATGATTSNTAGSRQPPPDQPPSAAPEPLELAEATALAREIEAEREALRAPLLRDRTGQVDSLRQSRRRRHLLLVEAALLRQRLAVRHRFLDRADAALGSGPVGPPRRAGPPNPKASLLLDDLARGVDDLGRLVSRLGRVVAELRRLGDDPRGPARSQAEALADRGASLARDGLSLDRRLARLQGTLAGMLR